MDAEASDQDQKRQRYSKLLFALIVIIILVLTGVAWNVHTGEQTLEKTHLAKSPPPPTPLQCAEQLPVNFLLGQLIMIGLPADEMVAQAPLFAQYQIGGAVLMTSPVDPNDGSIKAFKKAAASHSVPVLIATDEEGGEVQRFNTLGALPSPAQVAETRTPPEAQQLVAAHAQKLHAVGLDMVLGPLADVAPEQGQSPLGNRVFSSDPSTVSDYAGAYVRGWQNGGLLPTLKHFPGMGSATGNTDYTPATTPPLASLISRDFIPYQNASKTDIAVMVGNQNVPDWFTGPASLSPVVNQYLRQNLGYQSNFIITDSLSANAITSTISIPDAVVKAVMAGNDMVIIVNPNAGLISAQANEQLMQGAEAALQKAVQNESITKQHVAQSVVRKLTAQHISPCTVSKKN